MSTYFFTVPALFPLSTLIIFTVLVHCLHGLLPCSLLRLLLQGELIAKLWAWNNSQIIHQSKNGDDDYQFYVKAYMAGRKEGKLREVKKNGSDTVRYHQRYRCNMIWSLTFSYPNQAGGQKWVLRKARGSKLAKWQRPHPQRQRSQARQWYHKKWQRLHPQWERTEHKTKRGLAPSR